MRVASTLRMPDSPQGIPGPTLRVNIPFMSNYSTSTTVSLWFGCHVRVPSLNREFAIDNSRLKRIYEYKDAPNYTDLVAQVVEIMRIQIDSEYHHVCWSWSYDSVCHQHAERIGKRFGCALKALTGLEFKVTDAGIGRPR